MRFKKNWKWEIGRQALMLKAKIPYFKLLVLSGRTFDIYLLKFPEGSRLVPHKDPVDGKRHYRVNVVLRPAEQGGIFLCNGAWVNFPRFKFFRPDQLTHGVSKIEKGERLVLSIGWVRS